MAGALPSFLTAAGAPGRSASLARKAAGTRPALRGSPAHLPPRRAQQGARAQAGAQPASVGTANCIPEEVNDELWVYGQQSLNAVGQAQLFWDCGVAEPFSTQQSFIQLGIH